MWKGDKLVKLNTVSTFFFMFVAKMAAVVHPLLLGYIIEKFTSCHEEDEEDLCNDAEYMYIMILVYVATKFSAELINYLREVPFVYIAANAEKHIASQVYSHVQGLSLAWHLHRETGKVIRIVGKGAHSFAMILRYILFSILPLIVEIVFILIVIGYKYDIKFFLTNFICFFIYSIVTVGLTEYRSKHFKY